MHSNSTINRIRLVSSALALVLMAACDGPVRVPIQPQPQAPAHPVLINPLGQFVLDQRRPGMGAQFAPVPGRKSAAEALRNQLLDLSRR